MARRKAKGFSSTLDATREQKRNHPANRDAKALLRRNVLDEIGADRARVFDAFAGRGEMWRHVWRKASWYVGCDQEYWSIDERRAFVADNRRVMRCTDLTTFNIFDFDAFGSPWEQAIIMAARRPVAAGERIGLVFTDGTNLDLSMGGLAAPLRELAGFIGIPAGLARSHDEIVDRALHGLFTRMRVKPMRRWEASGATGAKVKLIGIVVEGLSS